MVYALGGKVSKIVYAKVIEQKMYIWSYFILQVVLEKMVYRKNGNGLYTQPMNI